MTDEDLNGNGNGSTVVWPHKFWRLAVILTVVVVAYFAYVISASSIRSDDTDKENDRLRVENATLTAENKALVEANVILESNLEQLKVHVISLTAIIEELSGADNHTETPATTTPPTTPPATTPETTVPPTTTAVIPDDSIHAGLPPDASNPHGG